MSTWSDCLISRVSDEPSFTRSEQRKLGGKGKVSPGLKAPFVELQNSGGLFLCQSVNTRLNIVTPCWYSCLEGTFGLTMKVCYDGGS